MFLTVLQQANMEGLTVFCLLVIIVLTFIVTNQWIKINKLRIDATADSITAVDKISTLQLDLSKSNNQRDSLKEDLERARIDYQQSEQAYVELQKNSERIINSLEQQVENWEHVYFDKYQAKDAHGKFLPREKRTFDLFELYCMLSLNITEKLEKEPMTENNRYGFMLITSGMIYNNLFISGDHTMITKAMVALMENESFSTFIMQFADRLHERNISLLESIKKEAPVFSGEMKEDAQEV